MGCHTEAQGSPSVEEVPHLCHTCPTPKAPSLLTPCPPSGPGALRRPRAREVFHFWKASRGGPPSPTQADGSGPEGQQALGRWLTLTQEIPDPTTSSPVEPRASNCTSPSLSLPIYDMGPFGHSEQNGVGAGKLSVVNCEVLGTPWPCPG